MKDYKEYARHIRDEISFLGKTLESVPFEKFISDEVLKRAVSRSLEIIGEAVKNIPVEVAEKYPDTEWKHIARLRDKLIHHYFGVDYYIIWDIIRNHLPVLRKNISAIIGE